MLNANFIIIVNKGAGSDRKGLRVKLLLINCLAYLWRLRIKAKDLFCLAYLCLSRPVAIRIDLCLAVSTNKSNI